MKKILNIIVCLNTVFLVLAAILTVVGNLWGAGIFVYTQIIGLSLAIKNKDMNGLVICSTFLAMNLYFLIK